ncbi:MAG: hypothetical protein A2104_09595 [Candidatus Melainabacteria bacterium GWF2_32_7]|nr:MAG: hypothetical protein A2104_09595 [Candidatus Melainabacteria bacterium GWF2_32_7]
MEIEEFKKAIKKQGPDVYLRKNPTANIVVNRPEIPIHGDPPRKEEYVYLKIYYDEDNHKYRYSEDNQTWTDLNDQQLEEIFYTDIKPFIL